MSEGNPIDVFISSTCRDLLDLRAVVKADLTEHRFRVRVSEDPTSGFSVEPSADTIQICLNNIEAATAVVCIIDRRYGKALEGGPHIGKSATHVEIEHARNLKKKIFYFVRDAALRDFQAIQNNSGAALNWIDDPERLRNLWREIEAFPEHATLSNWYDTFHSAVDLKETIRHRLIAQFPEYARNLAMAPDRLVRLTYLERWTATDAVHGDFRNLGIGPAFNIYHGMMVATDPTVSQVPLPLTHFEFLAGLRDGEKMSQATANDWMPVWKLIPGSGMYTGGKSKVVCKYENRFGDQYLLMIPFVLRGDWQPDGREEFYVANGPKDKPKWTRIS
jgi:hypothetical protein